MATRPKVILPLNNVLIYAPKRDGDSLFLVKIQETDVHRLQFVNVTVTTLNQVTFANLNVLGNTLST